MNRYEFDEAHWSPLTRKKLAPVSLAPDLSKSVERARGTLGNSHGVSVAVAVEVHRSAKRTLRTRQTLSRARRGLSKLKYTGAPTPGHEFGGAERCSLDVMLSRKKDGTRLRRGDRKLSFNFLFYIDVYVQRSFWNLLGE